MRTHRSGIARPDMLVHRPKLWWVLYIQSNFTRLWENGLLLVSSFFSFSLCFSLVTINRQTLYGSGILHQDYGIIQDFIRRHSLVWVRLSPSRLRNHSRFADEPYEICRLVHRLGGTFTAAGLIIAFDQTLRAVHSRNVIVVLKWELHNCSLKNLSFYVKLYTPLKFSEKTIVTVVTS